MSRPLPLPSHDSLEASPSLTMGDGVATITLNRPAHRNRLHSDDLQVLMEYFRQINADRSIRVVVLTGCVLPERPVFCAGFHMDQHGGEHRDATFEKMVDALEALRPVTICALNGSVYGGATDMVLACDLAIGVDGMEMRMPAAAIGLHYYPGGLARYVSRLGVTHAKVAFLTARAFTAPELLQMGYVQELSHPTRHTEIVGAKVRALLQLAPMAMETLKCSLNEIARSDYDAERLRDRQSLTQASEDFAEGRLAFAERRAPIFVGR